MAGSSRRRKSLAAQQVRATSEGVRSPRPGKKKGGGGGRLAATKCGQRSRGFHGGLHTAPPRRVPFLPQRCWLAPPRDRCRRPLRSSAFFTGRPLAVCTTENRSGFYCPFYLLWPCPCPCPCPCVCAVSVLSVCVLVVVSSVCPDRVCPVLASWVDIRYDLILG